jgi:hypothetical protein
MFGWIIMKSKEKLTLKHLLSILESGCHYRIYQPNRDCLMWESYFTEHSPYKLKKDLSWSLNYNKNYYYNNDYCYNVYENKLDNQTKLMLKKYGDYEVFSIEVSAVTPLQLSLDQNGYSKVDIVEDKYRPGLDSIDCINIFIK